MSRFEEPGDELYDDEFPDDEFDDDSAETVPCADCGAQIYEEAVQCLVCGSYVTRHASIWSGRPAWWIALAILGAVAGILALAGLVR